MTAAAIAATTDDELEAILAAAAAARAGFGAIDPQTRAEIMRACGRALLAETESLVALASEETNLSEARLRGEVARTASQFELYGEAIRNARGVVIDLADPDAIPAPRPDLRRTTKPIGVVLVFAASNFPFAFSVAGTDTAAAFAAGCPVIVKAHSGHPRTSRAVADIIRRTLESNGCPAGPREGVKFPRSCCSRPSPSLTPSTTADRTRRPRTVCTPASGRPRSTVSDARSPTRMSPPGSCPKSSARVDPPCSAPTLLKRKHPLMDDHTLVPRTLHVSATSGTDDGDGTSFRPFRTISAAAEDAQPGDTVRVAGGVYRERVDPPRGGTDDAPITYAAAEGEQVVITGSDMAADWEHVAGQVWRYQIETSRFGAFNPYADVIRGDWFDPLGRVHHTGCVYRNGDWLIEATSLDELHSTRHPEGLWFAEVDGDADRIISLGEIRPAGGDAVPADTLTFRYGGKLETTPEGRTYSTSLKVGDWLRFDGVDVGSTCRSIDIDVAADLGGGGRIEFRLDTPDGPLLGVCDVPASNEPNSWRTLTVPIAPRSGTITLVARFTTAEYEAGTTTIYAQFPDGDPKAESVEINVRQTVFYPSRNFIDNIHVRGFTLRNAASNWAPPSSEQTAVIGTNWSRSWVIENNTVSHSKCSGLSLGKYGDGTDNTNDAGDADPYTRCVRDALANGWNRARVGSHIVRNNHIHHCEQTGIVGSLGCAFSVVTGNEIHDIHNRRLFTGFEQAGLKFHGAVDAVIADNHIYRCGQFGIWLDWMCQGAQVARNLLHDNEDVDLFLEMQHGPLLVANNILLSRYAAFINSKGMAFAHNLFSGRIAYSLHDTRMTPHLAPHDTAITDLADSTPGDHRFYNNILLSPDGAESGGPYAEYWDGTLDGAVLPAFAAGNVFANAAVPSRFDSDAALHSAEVRPQLVEQSDGWYLTLSGDSEWSSTSRRVVTTEGLGAAGITGLPYENRDGTPIDVDTDYFGDPRDTRNPYPGPFDRSVSEPVKVWPARHSWHARAHHAA